MDHKNRIHILDILRGFALIGIFIVNIQLMRSHDFLKITYGFAPPYDGTDQLLSLIMTVFFEGAFISLFTFLFGVGFSLFIKNAHRKGLHASHLFRRRMTGLLFFGLFHLIFLWLGDILTLYAVSGFLLLLFQRMNARSLMKTGIAFLIGFALLLFARLAIPASVLFDIKQTGAEQVTRSVAAYDTAPSLQWFYFRILTEVPDIIFSNMFLIPFAIGMFLIGLSFGKAGVFMKIEQFEPLLKKGFKFSVLLSLPLMIALTLAYTGLISLENFQGHLVDSLSRLTGIPLAFVYLTGLVILIHHNRLPHFIKQLFASMGRMALTNYLGQTVLALGIIYSFGLYNNLSYGQSLLLVAGILIFQAFFSRVWLAYFKQGPLEGLWRSFTYRKTRPAPSPHTGG